MMRFILGLALAVVVVLGNGLVTWNTTGLSYERFTWVAYAGLNMYPETEDEEPGGCTDTLDNDMDELIDCEDPDCFTVPPCGTPAPAISPVGLIALMTILALVGYFGITRRRRQEV